MYLSSKINNIADPDILLKGEAIKMVICVTNLGIVIDNYFTFKNISVR